MGGTRTWISCNRDPLLSTKDKVSLQFINKFIYQTYILNWKHKSNTKNKYHSRKFDRFGHRIYLNDEEEEWKNRGGSYLELTWE